jgi:cysteine desulfurase/selenocysteine lyase
MSISAIDICCDECLVIEVVPWREIEGGVTKYLRSLGWAVNTKRGEHYYPECRKSDNSDRSKLIEARTMLDVRQDFPLLRNRPELCYLDSAATSQKPDAVIETVAGFLSHDYANVRRGVHHLSDMADGAYQSARETVARFIHAKPNEIIFTQNATASINIVARGYCVHTTTDKVYVTNAEHNSNILPWFRIGPLRFFDHQMRQGLDFDPNQTRLVAMTHLSNVLGQITPVPHVTRLAHSCGIPVLVDAAQSIGHLPVSVEELGADLLAFSGHKMLALTGIGVLYIREQHQDEFAPCTVGGGTVTEVNERGYTWASMPDGLEAGTPPIVEAVSLMAAIDYLNDLGIDLVSSHIAQVTQYCNNKLLDIGITPLGGPDKHGLVSFNLDELHPHDVAFELDKLNIAVRAGHHCAHLCHKFHHCKGSVRASFHVYNTLADVDRLIEGLEHVRRTLWRSK